MSQTLKKPAYYNTVMPYLILDDPRGFIDFAINVFGANTRLVAEDENDPDRGIMHAEITIGDSTIMIGGSSDQWHQQTAGLYITVDDADSTYQKALDAGAETVTELSDQEYGSTGGVKDPFGNTWWITSMPRN